MGRPTDSDPLADTAAADGAAGAAGAGIAPTQTGLAGGASGPTPTDGGHPTAIGRYRIDGVLGHGAMGTVFAAHDPDLERQVALKVLRGSDSTAAKQRLLRDARAIARASHPAVVTVHEVGTAGGIDYIAMELVDGGSLQDWIRTAKPTQPEILAAFEVAGRGLAAAHAAGLVHRDFKPHNVLRSKRGRVVVTDFGLARAALDEPEPPSGADANQVPTGAGSMGSLSSTLTATGALLGTPAYMAPEQHDQAAVGPAADQFAYCVALWEALSGTRPFSGETLAEVRRQIERGPDPDSEDRIPRRLRGVLRRGLAVDPADRFRSMDALLATLARRRRRWWPVIAGAAIVAAAIIFVATRGSAPAALPGCGSADAELAAYRSAPERAVLAASPIGARALADLDAFAADWVDVQRAVCARRDDPELARRATCLHAVKVELEVSLIAVGTLAPEEIATSSVIDLIGDPRACGALRPPNRVVLDREPAIGVIREASRSDKARLAAPDPGQDAPCLRMVWLLSRMFEFSDRRQDAIRSDASAAIDASARCGDDRLAAYVSIMSVTVDASLMSGDPDAMMRIKLAVDLSGGDRLLAAVAAFLEGLHAAVVSDIDGAIEHSVRGVEGARAIGARDFASAVETTAGRWLVQRAGPGDAANAERLYRAALPDVEPDDRADIQRALFQLAYEQGRVEEALKIAAELDDPGDDPADEPPGCIAVSGRLVDESGAPVGGARVVARGAVTAYREALEPLAPRNRTAVTAADGTFTIPSVPPDSIVIAAAGDRYSFPVVPAPDVELRLVRTGAVHGRILNAGDADGRLEVHVDLLPPPLDRVEFTPLLAADGTWRFDHVPYGKARVVVEHGAMRREYRFADLVIDRPVSGPIDIDLTRRGVRMYVVARNKADYALSFSIAWVVRGKFSGAVVDDLNGAPNATHAEGFPRAADDIPVEVRPAVKPGDVLVIAPSVELGEITVCAIGVVGNFMDNAFRARFDRHIGELELGCKPVTVTAPDQIVVVDVPPMKRLGD